MKPQQSKILISPKAEQCLEAMLKDVLEGFTSGHVKKSQLASWIIQHFHESYFSKQIDHIRADHFDQIAHLKAVVKRMEAAKRSDDRIELGALLQPLQKGGAKRRKRTPGNADE